MPQLTQVNRIGWAHVAAFQNDNDPDDILVRRLNQSEWDAMLAPGGGQPFVPGYTYIKAMGDAPVFEGPALLTELPVYSYWVRDMKADKRNRRLGRHRLAEIVLPDHYLVLHWNLLISEQRKVSGLRVGPNGLIVEGDTAKFGFTLVDDVLTITDQALLDASGFLRPKVQSDLDAYADMPPWYTDAGE